MSMTRRRSPTWSLAENAERGVGKQPHGLIWLLATMSICLWFFLFYFHFMVVGDGGGGGDQSVNLQPAATLESVEHVALKSPVVDDSVTEPDSAALKSHVVDKFVTEPHVVDKFVTEPDSVALESHVVDEFVTEQDSVALESPVVDGSVTELDNVALESPVIDKSVTEPYNVVVERAEWPFSRAMRATDNKSDSCGGRYIYVHDLPSRFNEDMLKECRSLSLWTDMCKFITNAGMGPPLENTQGVFSDKGWYATNQFAVDVIFSNRMKQYECLTNDSSIAAAVFVPFYAGFDIARYLWGYNISMRDAASLDLVDWLTKRPEWRVMDGKDHFLVAGRITWDFRRLSDKESDWGNKLLFLPAARNISTLVVESSPWNANDFGIPYPTYFHPASDADVVAWQDRMRNLERKWLFSFAGAPRPGNSNSIRGQIIDQCKRSKGGKLLECDFGESKCHSPSSIMQMFQSSIFCLQPQGDSYTRRSAFDSMLAGCIPVFFHPGSAYVQYTWHLPKNYTKYSVYIPEDDIRKGKISIEKRLSQIPPEQVKLMREEVINLIPRLIYADPRSKLETLKDAFDVSVQAMIDRVSQLRRDVMEGHADENIVEENSWKYALLDEGQGNVGPHEWDPLFSKPMDEGRDSGVSSARLATKSDNNKQKDQQR